MQQRHLDHARGSTTTRGPSPSVLRAYLAAMSLAAAACTVPETGVGADTPEDAGGNNSSGGDGGAPPDDPPSNQTIARGGALYDKWWVAAGLSAPTVDHPLWASRPDTTSNSSTGSSTWRCKECHGWDYLGVDGAYSQGSHRTGFPGILGTALTSEQLFDVLRNDEATTPGGHGYGSVGLGDDDIEALVAFVTSGAIDVSELYDDDRAFLGDAAAGDTLYNAGVRGAPSCASCHGVDGLTPPPGADEDYDHFLGAVARGNPAELQHKIRFGQPGTAMPALEAFGATLEEVRDLGAHLQTLPEGP